MQADPSSWLGQAVCSGMFNLSAGNTISAVFYHVADATVALTASGNTNWIAIHQLS
jgi:hypothetical protein